MPERSGFLGWRMVALAFAGQAITIGATFGPFTLFVRPLVDEFGASYAAVNLGMSAMSVLMALTGTVVGPLLDRRSIRTTMAGGALVCAATLASLSLATRLWQLGALYSLGMATAISMGGALPAAALVSRWFDRQRGRALGVANMGPPAGVLAFATASGPLIEAIGWRATLQVFAGVSLLLLPATLFWVVDRPAAVGQAPDGGAAAQRATAVAPPAREDPPWTTRALTRSRDFWGLALAMGIFSGVGTGWIAQVGPFGADLGLGPASVSLALGIGSAIGMAGTLAFGALADHADLRRLFGSAMALQALAFGLLRIFPSHAALVAGSSLFGIGSGGALPVYTALMARSFGGASLGRALGLAGLVMIPFTFGAPLAAAALRDATGNYRLALVALLAGLGLAAGSLALRGQPTPPEQVLAAVD